MGREDGVLGVSAWTREKDIEELAPDTEILVRNLSNMSRGIMTPKVSIELSPKGTRDSTARMKVHRSAIPDIVKAGMDVKIIRQDPEVGGPAASKPPEVGGPAASKPSGGSLAAMEKKVQETLEASLRPFPGPTPSVAPPTPPVAPQPSPAAPDASGEAETSAPEGSLPEEVRKLMEKSRGELMKECSKLKLNWQGNRRALAWRLARYHGLVK